MTTNTDIANTINRQIPTIVKMRVGCHDRVAIDKGLRFKVGGRRQTWIEITLTPADTYTVELVKWHRTNGRVIAKSVQGVYNDMLGNVIESAFAGK